MPISGGVPNVSASMPAVRGFPSNIALAIGEIIGPLSATEDTADTASATGTLASGGTLAATEAADTAAFSGALASSGTLAATEAADTAAFVGTLLSTGTLSGTEASDTAVASGQDLSTGALAATESPDTASIAGTAGSVVTGTLPQRMQTAMMTNVNRMMNH